MTPAGPLLTIRELADWLHVSVVPTRRCSIRNRLSVIEGHGLQPSEPRQWPSRPAPRTSSSIPSRGSCSAASGSSRPMAISEPSTAEGLFHCRLETPCRYRFVT
jgi:hypothetical protein